MWSPKAAENGEPVRHLEPSDVEPTAQLLAASFRDTPSYAAIFPDTGRRREGLADLFRLNLRLHAEHGCTYVSLQDEEVVATVTIRPPRGIRVSTASMIKVGLPIFALRRGLGVVRRMLAVGEQYDVLEAEVTAGRPHWYVHMMAVDPSSQGKGVGSQLFAEALAATANLSENPTSLATQEEINLRFYARFGFEVVDYREMPGAPGQPNYPCWSMHRDAPE
jgi:GNAT superfamily N-acetyltransferase